jgi:hypothetical protein
MNANKARQYSKRLHVVIQSVNIYTVYIYFLWEKTGRGKQCGYGELQKSSNRAKNLPMMCSYIKGIVSRWFESVFVNYCHLKKKL